MEFFINTKAVRLKSHLNKYLVADEDQHSTRQSKTSTARKSRWLVELVDTNEHTVRLKSCHGHYLSASAEPFLLGMTGHKVLQTKPENISKDMTIEWQPIADGLQVKLKTHAGTFLRANGGTPPWRNSITHDTAATNDWVVWDVEEVDVPEDEGIADYLSMVSTFSSLSDEISGLDFEPHSPISVKSNYCDWPPPASPSPRLSMKTPKWSMKKKQLIISPATARTSAMDLFQSAKSVRLKSSHGKYLSADEDELSITQSRHGSTKSAKWTVEFVENTENIIRLKSCYGKYLTASNTPFLLGMTGRKVTQTDPKRLDSSIEWEPIRENGGVKLKTRYGQFLRANGGFPPYRNSVTHDIPSRSVTKDWVFWEVHVVEILPENLIIVKDDDDSFVSECSTPSTHQSSKSASFSGHESSDNLVTSPPKVKDGRLIYFHITDEYGEIEEGFEELCITFKGNGVQELKNKLEMELGIDGITVCTRSPLNGENYPLRLQLPPNNAPMHIIVVPKPSSQQEGGGTNNTGLPV